MRQIQRSCYKKMEAEKGGRCCKPRELLEPQKLEKLRRDSESPAGTLNFDFWTPEQ